VQIRICSNTLTSRSGEYGFLKNSFSIKSRTYLGLRRPTTRAAGDLPSSNGAKGKLGNADLKEVYHAEKKAFG
jgi:hypothetical protein